MKIIKNNGGKVKIYAASNFGTEHGYQYIFVNSKYKDKIPLKEAGVGESRHFVIDFTTDDNGDPYDPLANKKLEFLVGLSMCFIDSAVDRKYASEFLFIMKDFEDSYKSKDAICIFDRHGFFSKDDIYSSKEFKNSEYRPIELENIIFNGKDGSFGELNKETGMWKNQKYIFVNYKLFYTVYDYERWF